MYDLLIITYQLLDTDLNFSTVLNNVELNWLNLPRTELFIENAEQASLLADHNPSLLSTRKLESLHQKRQLKSKIA